MHFTVMTTQDIDIERYCYDTENLNEEYIEKIIQCPKGKALSICRDMFKRNTKTMKEHPEYKWSLECLKKAIKEGEEACKEYLKESEYLLEDDEGNLYNEDNPDGIYDWCSVGGRWTGYFKAKEGTKGEVSDYGGVFDRQAPAGYFDEIAKKDIDLAGMFKDHVHNLKIEWKKAQEQLKKKDCLDEIKKVYGVSLKEYIAQNKDDAFVTCGFINKDGEYIETHDWDNKSNANIKLFWEWYNSLDDEDILIIYDCHT